MSTGPDRIRFGDLRGMLQYVPQFRDRTFVIAIDGGAAASPNFSNTLLDIAALRSLSIHLVLVHGASAQITELAAQRGVTVSNVDGTGITDDVTLDLSIDAITRLTSTLMQHLTTKDLRAATTNAILAHRAGVIGGQDLEHTGRVDRVDEGSLRALLDDGIIPIVPPIGYDGQGNTLRVNSDEAACEVALRQGASKIIYVMDEMAGDGCPELPSECQFSIAEARDYLTATPLCAGWTSKWEHAIRACESGVPRVHLIPGWRGDAPLLEELFSNEGTGTMIFADAYHRIREAERADIEEMISMMRPGVEKDKLLYLSREEIQEKLSDYFVIEIDGNVVGSAALHVGPDKQLAELACLFIKRSHESQGYGKELVRFAEERARSIGVASLFALSTQASDFFTTVCGFVGGEAGILPADRRDAYEAHGRNSRVLVKELG